MEGLDMGRFSAEVVCLGLTAASVLCTLQRGDQGPVSCLCGVHNKHQQSGNIIHPSQAGPCLLFFLVCSVALVSCQVLVCSR